VKTRGDDDATVEAMTVAGEERDEEEDEEDEEEEEEEEEETKPSPPLAMKLSKSMRVTTPATTDRVVCVPLVKHFCSATTSA